jgi:hypothetical protein
LLQGADGTVLGREKCRVEAMTEAGFEVAVDRIATEDVPAGPRSTLVYRAWPAVDGRSEQSAQRQQSEDQPVRSDSMDQHTQASQEENR